MEERQLAQITDFTTERVKRNLLEVRFTKGEPIIGDLKTRPANREVAKIGIGEPPTRLRRILLTIGGVIGKFM